MDIKEEVRRRIADLTRHAYERGYRDGAQSALAEIESIAAEDIAEQLAAIPAPLEAISDQTPVRQSQQAEESDLPTAPVEAEAEVEPAVLAPEDAAGDAIAREAEADQSRSKSAAKPKKKAKDKAPAKPRGNKTEPLDPNRSKLAVVQEALQTLLAEKGSARRDEILAMAQAANPQINKHDLNNGLRALTKREAIRLVPNEKGLYVPA